MGHRCWVGWDPRGRALLLVFRAGMVSLFLSAGGTHAHLCAFFALPDFCREKEMYLLQCLHVRLPPGNRCDELRQQGTADERSSMRPLFRLRPDVSYRSSFLR